LLLLLLLLWMLFDKMILKCSHLHSAILLKLQAQADEYTKSYCKSISQSELVGYRAEQKAFKEKYGEEAFEKQTRKRKNAEAAARGENKKTKSLKKYEEALKAMEEESEDESEEEQIDENEDDGKVPAVKDKKASAAAEVTAAAVTRAGPALAPFNPLDRLLQERQLMAQRLYMLTYGGITQGDQLGQAIRSMNQERMVAQDLAIQRALLREEMAQRSSHQGIFASTPLLDPRLAGMTHLDPRLADLRMEQMYLRREVDLSAASAPTDAATADISQEKSWASTPEEDRLEQLSLRLGGAAQRDRLAQIMRPEKPAAHDRLADSVDGNMTEASSSLSSMQQQVSSLLREVGISSSVARRNSPQQQHPQQDRMSLIMSLEGLAGKSADERMAALSNPIVLYHIQNLQLLQQRRLQLQEQLLQQRLAQAAFLPGRTNVLAEPTLNGQLTQEEIRRQEVEKRRAAALEQLKK
jgi:hypothetical protein